MPAGTIVEEGGVRLLVPEAHSVSGPGRISGSVFFNEQMAFNRDVSVMVVRALERRRTVADAMAATGARAVRLAAAAPDAQVTANDVSADAFAYIQANIELNGLENCAASNRNLHSLLAEGAYDYVDVDPFGSPVPFLHSAILGCRRDGVLAVTATDAAPLSGAHRAKCARRYRSEPVRGPMCHEGGLRILLGAMARELAKFDRGMEPLLSFSADHYYRAYVRVKGGAARADRALSELAYLSYDPASLERSFSPERDERHRYGPMWGGPLFDRGLLARMSPEGAAEPARCGRMLSLWSSELDGAPALYEMGEVASHLKMSTPRLDALLGELSELGPASATHMSPTAFKTLVPLEGVLDAFRRASPDRRGRDR